MKHLARVPAWGIIALWVAWWAAVLAAPWVYAWWRGWATYWALSLGEFLETLIVLVVPPAVVTALWRRARRWHGGEGAA